MCIGFTKEKSIIEILIKADKMGLRLPLLDYVSKRKNSKKDILELHEEVFNEFQKFNS